MLEPSEALAAIGVLPDAEIEPAMAALQLARLDRPEDDWRGASDHLSVLARESASIGAVMAGRSGEARVGALAGLLHARHDYRGDTETYDALDNANLIAVIRRRRGLPVALGLIWLHCLRAAGWDGHGIDFPGHFLLALRTGSGRSGGSGRLVARQGRLLIDPFAQGITLGNARLLAMLESRGQDQPGLSPGITRPMSTRAVLLRLQRNLVQRRLAAGEIEAALGSLEGMLLIAPDDMTNWLDAAELNRLLGRPHKAGRCLERVIDLAPDSPAARIARQRLGDLRPG